MLWAEERRKPVALSGRSLPSLAGISCASKDPGWEQSYCTHHCWFPLQVTTGLVVRIKVPLIFLWTRVCLFVSFSWKKICGLLLALSSTAMQCWSYSLTQGCLHTVIGFSCPTLGLISAKMKAIWSACTQWSQIRPTVLFCIHFGCNPQ